MRLKWRLFLLGILSVYSIDTSFAISSEHCKAGLTKPEGFFTEHTTVEEALGKLNQALEAPTSFDKGYRSRYIPGQLIKVKLRETISIKVALDTSLSMITTISEGQTRTGRYLHEMPGGKEAVEILVPIEGYEGYYFPLEAQSDQIEPLGLEAGQTRKLLDAFKPRRFQFSIGEEVRYRDTDGKIKIGILTGESRQNRNRGYYIRNGNEEKIVSKAYVWKHHENQRTPYTPRFNVDWLNQDTHRNILEDGEYKHFLEGANKLTSLHDFWELPFIGQLETLQIYLRAFFKYDLSIGDFEVDSGWTGMGDILACGVGVCRHFTIMMATILAEAGYSVRVAKAMPEPRDARENGHAWLEVDYEVDGGIHTYVFDPTNNVIIPLVGAEIEATIDPKSDSAVFYTNPHRELQTGL